MKKFNYLFLSTLLFISCSDAQEKEIISSTTEISNNDTLIEEIQIINPNGETIRTRFNVPKGFQRIETEEGSFGSYLRDFKLKPHGTPVYTYRGDLKYQQEVAVAVLDIDVGNKDLQQCADAVMRLKSEYHFQKNEHDSIHFNFTNGFRVDYSKWKEGYRISSNYKSWYKKYSTDTSYANFREYMDMIFMFAGTLSLSKELKAKNISHINVGDVFIFGGSPGHAVTVIDVAVNKKSGERLFMIAQSYMPAQDIHVLKNFNNEEISPWYSNQFEGSLSTPEWTFEKKELSSF